MISCSKSITLLISIVTAISSSYGNETLKGPPLSSCKSVLLENCAKNFCIVNISVIHKCPSNNTDDEIRTKCENFNNVDLFADTFLFRPVTDELENVTYWNIYCAKCNRKNLNVGGLKFWTLRAYHRNDSVSNFSFISDVNVAVRDNIRVDHSTKQLISNVEDVHRKILPLRYLPPALKNSSYEVCSPDSNEIIEFFIKSNTEKVLSVPEEFNCTGKRFCSSKPLPKTCRYFDRKNAQCPENEIFIEKIDFIHEGDRVIINDGRTFDSDVYFNSTDGAEIILCPSIDDENYVIRIRRKLIEFAKYVSTFLLLVFIVTKTYKKEFQNLIQLILYSYCVILLAVYLYQLVNILIPGPLIFRTYIMLYIYLCHALWMAIISYEYWYIISTTAKYQKYLFELKKYRVYGFIGWAVPGLLLCLVYPSLTKEDKSAVCPRFANLHHNFIADYLSDLAKNLHYILLAIYFIIFLILIPVMALQGYNFIRLATKSRIAQRRNSPSELDYLLFFTKTAYLMGFHWMLICIMVIVEAIFGHIVNIFDTLNNIGSFLLALHGIFIFFVYGFEDVCATYKRTRKISFKTQSSDMRPGLN